MESELLVGRQRIRFDREATLALYRDKITVAGDDECNCLYCKNYAAQREKVFPEEFRQLLEKLGIDPMREWEAFDYDQIGPGSPLVHLYGGWFLFCGELIEGLNEKPYRAPAFSYGFTSSFPTGTLPEDVKICAVEFVVDVPWILPPET